MATIWVRSSCALAALSLCLAAVAAPSGGSLRAFAEKPGAREFTGTLIVQRKEAVSDSAARGAFSGAALRSVQATREYVVRVPKGSGENAEARRLMATGLFEYVHPNWRVFPCGETNDPKIREQWHLWRIAAPRAWDTTMGDPSVVVAVVDSGVALNHPDLQGQFVPGYNAESGIAQADGGDVTDVMPLSHGTRVAGIVAAKANNGIGIAGVGPNLKIMPVRVSNVSSGTTTLDTVLAGVRWAADHGARVVNVSYTGIDHDSVETAGQYCDAHGVALVWAAGNDGEQLDAGDWPSVVIVGASDHDDKVASFSNYGEAIDVMAPGVDMLSTTRTGGYGTSHGTSFAAPVVAATYALTYPFWASGRWMADFKIRLTAYDMGGEPPTTRPDYLPGTDDISGWGRIDVARAVEPHHVNWDCVFLPMPPGFVTGSCSVNDVGASMGVLTSGIGEVYLAYWPTLTSQPILLPPSERMGWPAWSLAGMNESGEVAVNLVDPSNWYNQYPCRWTPGVSFKPFPESSFPWSVSRAMARSIDNKGRILLNPLNGYLGIPFLWCRDDSCPGTGSFPGGWHGNWVNEKGEVGGVSGSVPVAWVPGGDAYQVEAQGHASQIRALNEQGEAVGFIVYNGSSYFGGFWNIRTGEGWHQVQGTQLYGVNNRAEISGIWTNGATIFGNGLEWTDVLPRARGVPRGYSAFEYGFGINELGWVGGQLAGKNKPTVPVVMVRSFDVLVDLGQVGSNPVYVGTLPTTLVLGFRDENNVPIPNSDTVGNYDSETGILHVVMPASVEGEFRIYLKPERYLGKVYPALTEPPLPPGTSSIPIWQVMVTGDVDGDNVVSVFDYNVMSEVFDLTVYDPGFDPRADLDGDQAITVFDYNLLSENFDKAGDE